METCCNYIDKTMFVSTDERWLINRIMKFSKAHPNSVEVIRYPERNDGCLYCKLPSNWLKITPPAKREMTAEQKAAAAERLRNAHK